MWIPRTGRILFSRGRPPTSCPAGVFTFSGDEITSKNTSRSGVGLVLLGLICIAAGFLVETVFTLREGPALAVVGIFFLGAGAGTRWIKTNKRIPITGRPGRIAATIGLLLILVAYTVESVFASAGPVFALLGAGILGLGVGISWGAFSIGKELDAMWGRAIADD